MSRLSEFTRSFAVRRRPLPADWLEENIKIPRKMSPRSPGPFRALPFQRAILNTWHPESGTNDVVVAAGTQLMKTLSAVLGVAYRIKWNPLPALYVVPAEDFARKVIAFEKFHPLINANPCLAELKPTNSDLFQALEMHMAGMELSLVGANSPTQLSGRSKGIIVVDEACKIIHRESEDAPEAHPIKLATERAKDFKDIAFRYLSSSPNHENHLFWHEFCRGDQCLFHLQCPNCPADFPLEFDHDEATGYRSIVWPETCRNAAGVWVEDAVKAQARYICPKCGFPIPNEAKIDMLDTGQWIPEFPAGTQAFRSFRLPSLYSPRITWGDVAVEFLNGHDLFGLENFTNSWLAKPFSKVAVRVKKEAVERCRADWYLRRQVRGDVDYLLAAADPGQHRTHWMIGAVHKNGDIAILDWGTCMAVEDLGKLPDAIDGHTWPRGLCDAGYMPERVETFCYNTKGRWWPTRGQDATFGTWSEADVRSHPGLKIYNFSDFTLKYELYVRRIQELGTPRVWIPGDADAELVAHLSGQQMMEDRGLSRTRRWKRLPNDHWGDCLKQILLSSMIVETQRRAMAQVPTVDMPTADDGPNSRREPHRVS